MKKTKKQIIYAFIDSQNLNLGIRDQGWRLDFQRFRIYLKDKFNVVKAFLFIGFIPKNKKLYQFLKRCDYTLVFKPVVESHFKKVHKIKGNVDAELVLQSMIEYIRYDKAIIITGDGDFYCLVNYLKLKNKLERLIIPNQRKYSQLLLPFKKDILFLNNMREKLGKKNGSVAVRTKP
ncbi:NYN domain-containing protein [Candidatus Roizmanbacteria bacterium]|nr:NYN domain-containing protein [Candidatus Roizmanbacteria bacterium]